jgi:hypothetical protein
MLLMATEFCNSAIRVVTLQCHFWFAPEDSVASSAKCIDGYTLIASKLALKINSKTSLIVKIVKGSTVFDLQICTYDHWFFP